MIESQKKMCKGGKQATRLCATKDCYNQVQICNSLVCQCLALHQNCLVTAPISSIMSKIDKKISSLQPVRIELIKWAQDIQTMILQMIEQTKFICRRAFNYQQLQMFYYLKQTQNKTTICGSTVSKVINSLSKYPVIDLSQKIHQIKISLNSLTKQISKTISKANKLTNFSDLPQKTNNMSDQTQNILTKSLSVLKPNLMTRFSQSFHHSNLVIKQNKLSTSRPQKCNHSLLALLELPIEVFGQSNQVYKFIVTSQVMLGFYYLNHAVSQKFTPNLNKQSSSFNPKFGGYLFNYKQKKMYSHKQEIIDLQIQKGRQLSEQQQKQIKDLIDKQTQKSNIVPLIFALSCTSQYLFHVTYFPILNKVLFKNMSTNQTCEISMKTKTDDQLYPCIVFNPSMYTYTNIGNVAIFLGMQLI